MGAVLPWSALGLDNSYRVRDLWAHTDRGTPAEVSSESVTAHGVVMFRLKKQEGAGNNQ